jgi:hypothetical protein
MAALIEAFCPVTTELRCLLSEQRSSEAVARAVEQLRLGHKHCSDSFLVVVAELLQRSKIKHARKGRPSQTFPANAFEIGKDFEQLKIPGKADAAVHAELAEKYGCDTRTIERKIAAYKKAASASH